VVGVVSFADLGTHLQQLGLSPLWEELELMPEPESR
jgi:hypothetical protein